MITDVSSVTILTAFLGLGVKIYYLDYLILLFYLMLLFMWLSSSQGFPSGGGGGDCWDPPKSLHIPKFGLW